MQVVVVVEGTMCRAARALCAEGVANPDGRRGAAHIRPPPSALRLCSDMRPGGTCHCVGMLPVLVFPRWCASLVSWDGVHGSVSRVQCFVIFLSHGFWGSARVLGGLMVAVATNSGGNVLFGDVQHVNQHRGQGWKYAEMRTNSL
jgi:hypothetical protein